MRTLFIAVLCVGLSAGVFAGDPPEIAYESDPAISIVEVDKGHLIFKCIWVAKIGNVYKYRTEDGRIFTSPVQDVTKITMGKDCKIRDSEPREIKEAFYLNCKNGKCVIQKKSVDVIPAKYEK